MRAAASRPPRAASHIAAHSRPCPPPLRQEDGPLKSAIEEYAARVGFAFGGIFQIDGSKRSSHSNAFFTGFGSTKRIALFDTLVEQTTLDEMVAILAHEARAAA